MIDEYALQAAESWREVADTDGLRDHYQKQEEKPHAKQREFEFSPLREVMMLGANRSGKSKGLAAYIARKFRREGAKRGWLVCPSFGMARRNMVPDLFGDDQHQAMIPASEIAEIRLKPEWQYLGKDGWELTIKSAEQGAASFAGGAQDFIVFDEPPDWSVFKECQIRFGAGKRCDIRLAATLLPEEGQAGGICQWLWAEKIEPWLRGDVPPDFRIINVAMSDNPWITPEQLQLARRLYPPGSLDRRIRVDGELLPGLVGARCYVRFDRRLHVNRNLARKDVDPLKPLYLTVDVNVDPLGWGILQKHGKIWRKLDEIALRPGTIPEACDVMIQRYTGHRAPLVVCGDATAQRRTAQTGQTDYDMIAAALKGHFSLRFLIPEKNPPERDRVNLVNFMLGGGDSDVRFEVSHECPESIADYEQVVWKPDGSGIRKAHDKNDPYYQRTAWSDGDGYCFWMMESGAIKQALRGDRTAPKYPVPVYGFCQA